MLRRLDGERLLNVLHTTDKDSLVYWLEFKNDEELPAYQHTIRGQARETMCCFRETPCIWR